MVVPQPLRSLILASTNRQNEFGRDSAHLVVDVGYFTTDWLDVNGFSMDDRRSDGVPGGGSQIYQRIAGLIARDEGEQVDDIERIDKTMRKRAPFFYGRNIGLAPYLEQSRPLVARVVKEMQNNVGRLTNVRSVILSGGGAALYSSEISAAFPRVILGADTSLTRGLSAAFVRRLLRLRKHVARERVSQFRVLFKRDSCQICHRINVQPSEG
ncbi:plasmid segregation protein ParM [Paraburkholderia megapolitana]|uniref:Plasmid segregation protein ParM n=1 Tax=Paraburkholderia megapolitana TaxID=420953 RepID=A0A1I3VVQ8_9BURK|nr:plasmid segregation protein ParM [Paraburkholderia megapolitana]